VKGMGGAYQPGSSGEREGAVGERVVEKNPFSKDLVFKILHIELNLVLKRVCKNGLICCK
jgi:hypothetical protein